MSERRCVACRQPSWQGERCGVCQVIHEESGVNRAWCDGLHRGVWPVTRIVGTDRVVKWTIVREVGAEHRRPG